MCMQARLQTPKNWHKVHGCLKGARALTKWALFLPKVAEFNPRGARNLETMPLRLHMFHLNKHFHVSWKDFGVGGGTEKQMRFGGDAI